MGCLRGGENEDSAVSVVALCLSGGGPPCSSGAALLRRLLSHQGFRSVWREHWPLFALMAVMLLILLLQTLLGRGWYESFMMFPPMIAESWGNLTTGEAGVGDLREFSTLLSSGFLHGDLVHWGSNMIFMWMFGSLLGGVVGNRTMLAVFLVTTIAGGICDAYLRSGEMIPSLGASGGVMGLEGAYLGLALRFHLPDPQAWPLARPVRPSQLILFALIGVAFDLRGLWSGIGNTAYGAHLGGFLMGVVLTGLLLPLKKIPYARR